MKLCRFTENGRTRIGKIIADRVVDLSSVPGVHDSMRGVLARLPELRAAFESATHPSFALSDVSPSA